MNARSIMTLALVAAFAAGCVEPDAGQVDEPGAQGTPAPLVLDACQEQLGIFPMADEDVRGMLPDGFDPLPPLPPSVHPEEDPTGQSATLLYAAFFCDEPADTAFIIPWIPAMPPEELREEGVTYHAVAPTILAGSPETNAWFADAGLRALSTTIAHRDVIPATPAGPATEVTANGDGVALTLVGASPRSEAPTPEEWLRIFLVEDRAIVGIMDLHVSEHIHWQFGSARVTASGPGMLSPDQPGLSTHSAPGLSLTLTTIPVADAGME